jgi:drug/metabolite transporter (DMT)-like permease
MSTLALAILSIAVSVAAQFCLKAGMSSTAVKTVLSEPFAVRTIVTVFTDVFILGGFLLYGLGAVVWLGVLSKWDVSKAYPLVGLGFVFTAAIGHIVGENIGLTRSIGVALICIGVLFVGRS